jgi:hypothetical protein
MYRQFDILHGEKRVSAYFALPSIHFHSCMNTPTAQLNIVECYPGLSKAARDFKYEIFQDRRIGTGWHFVQIKAEPASDIERGDSGARNQGAHASSPLVRDGYVIACSAIDSTSIFHYGLKHNAEDRVENGWN